MIRRIEYWLDTLGAICVVSLCLLIVAIIISREAFSYGIPDGISIVRELMVPAILFPMSAATSRRAHVAIDVIANFFPASLNRWIAVLAAIIGIIAIGTLLAAGCVQLVKNFASGAFYFGDLGIPKWISRATYVVPFVFVTIRLFQIFWIDLLAAIGGKDAPSEIH